MKLFTITFFILISALSQATTEQLTKEDVKVINYLLKDSESIMFRRLYAAEKAKSAALTATSDEEKENRMKNFHFLSGQAEKAKELYLALNKIISQNSPDPMYTKVDCSSTFKTYDNAIEMINSLKEDEHITEDVAEFFNKAYKFSSATLQASGSCK